MKFVMSYSCGKDSTFALHKLIQQGKEPVALLIMVNEEQERSWFHGADSNLLQAFSDALEIPLILCPSKGADYAVEFEKGLKKAAEMGAEAAGFGDIDINGNREWCEERCKAVGLKSEFPLWRQGRKEIVKQILSEGYCCIIKSIQNTLLPKKLLGKKLSSETIRMLESRGVDICGENGEYHTIAVDGPVFKHRLNYHLGEILDFGDRSVIDLK